MELTVFVLSLFGMYGIFGLLFAFGAAMIYEYRDRGYFGDLIAGLIVCAACTAFAVLFNIMLIQTCLYRVTI